MLTDIYTNRTDNHQVLVKTQLDAGSLWSEFRNGSELAFTAIYKRYVHDLYHYGERLTTHRDIIEDSIHDFFVELWKHRYRYGEVQNLKFYLLKGFKYRLLKNLKTSRRYNCEFKRLEEYNFDIVFSKEAEWINELVSHEQKENILRNINQLSRREKEAITLRFYDGFDYEEIAQLMSLSIKSTYKLLYRALGVLRKTVSRIV